MIEFIVYALAFVAYGIFAYGGAGSMSYYPSDVNKNINIGSMVGFVVALLIMGGGHLWLIG